VIFDRTQLRLTKVIKEIPTHPNNGEHSQSNYNPLPHTSFIGRFLRSLRSFAAKKFVPFVLIRVSSSSASLRLCGSSCLLTDL
jgi:hypothetical protein